MCTSKEAKKTSRSFFNLSPITAEMKIYQKSGQKDLPKSVQNFASYEIYPKFAKVTKYRQIMVTLKEAPTTLILFHQ